MSPRCDLSLSNIPFDTRVPYDMFSLTSVATAAAVAAAAEMRCELTKAREEYYRCTGLEIKMMYVSPPPISPV